MGLTINITAIANWARRLMGLKDEVQRSVARLQRSVARGHRSIRRAHRSEGLGGVAALLLAGLFAGLLGACAGDGSGAGTTAAIAPPPGAGSQSPLAKSASVKVALLLPLSAKGRTAKVAKGLKQAAELALFEFDRPNVLLFTKDTKGTPAGARAAAEAAVQSGAELIIGPLFASTVRATGAVARGAGVPVIAFSTDRSVAGNGVYLLSFLAGDEVPRIVDFAIRQGRRRFAALIPQTPYGDVVERAFRNALGRKGGELVALARYPLDANGMMPPTKSVKEAIKSAEQSGRPVEALFLPGGPETLPTLSTLLPYYEIDTSKVQLLGNSGWDYANIGQEEPLLGGWFPAPDPKGWRAFTRRYTQTFGAPPPRIASLAYDAVSLALTLSRQPRGMRYSVANLTRASGFAGVDGLFRLRPDGTTERGLAVLEVQKYGARVLDPAPSAFGAPTRPAQPYFSSLIGSALN